MQRRDPCFVFSLCVTGGRTDHVSAGAAQADSEELGGNRLMSGQTYVLVESTYYLRKHPQIRYGVALVAHDEPIDVVIQTICDVSTDRRIVEKK